MTEMRRITVPLVRKERDADGFSVSVPAGEKSYQVEVYVDIDRIASVLGAKAVRATGKKSMLQGGMVRVRVVS